MGNSEDLNPFELDKIQLTEFLEKELLLQKSTKWEATDLIQGAAMKTYRDWASQSQ